LRKSVLLCILWATTALAQTPPPPATFLTDAEVRRAIQSAPEEVAGHSGLYSSKLSSPTELPVIGIRRTARGKSELHARFTDVWYVIDGEATLVTGGAIENGTETAPGEIRGVSIKGGNSRCVLTGEFAIIPAGTPHWISQVKGREILGHRRESARPSTDVSRNGG